MKMIQLFPNGTSINSFRSYLGLILILTFCVSCEQEKAPTENTEMQATEIVEAVDEIQTKETKAIITELATINQTSDPIKNIYLNSRRADHFAALANQPNAPHHGNNWYYYCRELLGAGSARECIRELESNFDPSYPLEDQMTQNNYILFELLALSYLRAGEQENCQNNHTAFSCIIPFKEEAIHQLPEGSTKAAQLYQSMYDRFPKPGYKWLINLAYMTLGKHPHEVPEKYLINYPNWNLEQKNFPRFKEVAMGANAAINGLSGGVCTDDFNNDGLLDIFMTDYGLDGQSRLLINNGKGGYDDRTTEAGLDGLVSGLNCVQADYNNDGFTDIFILRGAWLAEAGNHPNSLLKNNGDGTFSDVSASSGILSYHPTQTASWADFNRDGHIDLFIGNESGPGAINPCELYKNNGDGTFTNVAGLTGVNVLAFVKGAVWGDINNDLWPDLFISVMGGQNLLFKNNNGTFENISQTAGISEPLASFPCWFWDVNNDGYQDLYISGYEIIESFVVSGAIVTELEEQQTNISKPKLYINNGDETFKDVTEAYNIDKTSFAMGANFGDLDNDGYLDFYLGTGAPEFDAVTPNRMFRNVQGKKFEEVTSAGGFGHIQKGHAIAFADLDMDGDQDVYAVMGGAYEADKFTNVLYENPGFENNWIILRLIGESSNSSAIGARIQVQLDNGKSFYRTVTTGGSFGASSLQQEIGLGKARKIKKIIISWPSGITQTFEEIAVNQKIELIEGKDEVKIVTYDHIPFAAGTGAHHHH